MSLSHDFAHRARDAGWTLEEVAYSPSLCDPAGHASHSNDHSLYPGQPYPRTREAAPFARVARFSRFPRGPASPFTRSAAIPITSHRLFAKPREFADGSRCQMRTLGRVVSHRGRRAAARGTLSGR